MLRPHGNRSGQQFDHSPHIFGQQQQNICHFMWFIYKVGVHVCVRVSLCVCVRVDHWLSSTNRSIVQVSQTMQTSSAYRFTQQLIIALSTSSLIRHFLDISRVPRRAITFLFFALPLLLIYIDSIVFVLLFFLYYYLLLSDCCSQITLLLFSLLILYF